MKDGWRLAVELAQWAADGFLVGWVAHWLWVRYRRRGRPGREAGRDN